MSGEEGKPGWYMLSTKRGKEVLASKALERVCAEVFLPLLHQGSTQAKPQPAFPRRIFVRADLRSRWFEVAYSPGMRDFLKAVRPTEVPDSLIAKLKLAAVARFQPMSEAAPVSDSLRRLFDPRIASLGRYVALARMIEDRKSVDALGCR